VTRKLFWNPRALYVPLDPNVAFLCHFTTGVTGVYSAGRLNEHDLAFSFSKWFVLYSLWDDKHLSCLEVDPAVTEIDAHLPFDNDESLICICVTMPNKVSLELNQFEVSFEQ